MAAKFEVATIFKAIDKMSAPVRRMTTQLDLMLRSTQKQMRELGRTTDRMMGGIKKAGATAVVAGGLIAGGLWQSSQAGLSFEQTLANVSAKMGSTAYRGTKNFAMMEDAAKRVGAQTEFSATQSADALNFMAMAGFNAEQAVVALPGVVDLATASQTDLATATDIATDALGAFNLMSKDSAVLQKNLSRINDVLAKTSNSANLDMQQLFETMKKGGPVATAAGASIETVAAIAGTMAGAGYKGEIAGTAIANSFLNLSKPSAEASRVITRLGLKVSDASGKMRDMPDIIDDLNKGLKRLTPIQRQAAQEIIFGREGLAATMNVVAQGGDALRAYRTQLEKSTGAAAEMAKVSRDTTQRSLDGLKSAVEGVSIKLFESNRGPMRQAIEMATNWTRANGDLIAQDIGGFVLKVADNFGTLVSYATDIAKVVALLWGLNTAIKAVTIAQGAFNLIASANPLALLIASLTTVVALSDKFLANMKSMPDWVQRSFNQSMLMPLVGLASGIKQQLPSLDFGFGTDTTGAVSSPQERIATQITENTERSVNEVVIRDETQRAQIRNISGPQRLTVQSTGGF